MNWKYHVVHVWSSPSAEWEDIWLRPDEPNFVGNMGSMINLTVDAVGWLMDQEYHSKEVTELASRLKSAGGRFWFWPYLSADNWWGDEVSMIFNGDSFTKDELLECAQAYLRHKGYDVTGLEEMSREEAIMGQEDGDLSNEDDSH